MAVHSVLVSYLLRKEFKSGTTTEPQVTFNTLADHNFSLAYSQYTNALQYK